MPKRDQINLIVSRAEYHHLRIELVSMPLTHKNNNNMPSLCVQFIRGVVKTR